MAPRPGSSNGCGAYPRTGSPAPTPTRCWYSTSWTASVSRWRSPTPRGWPPTTHNRYCSPRSKASSPKTRKPRSPNATDAASCFGPAPGRSSPGKRPTATAASRAAPPPARHTTKSTNPRPQWCDASSPTALLASRCAKSVAASTPTPSRHQPANPPGPLHDLPAASQRSLHRPRLLQPHRISARPPPHPWPPAGAP